MPTYAKGNKFITKFMVNGTRYTKMHGTAAEGEAWELSARAALKLGKPIPQDEVKRVGGKDVGTVAGAFRAASSKRWLPAGDGSSKQMLNAETFMRWCGPNMSAPEAFGQENIDKFFEYLKTERRVANSTINKYRSAISVMLDYTNIDDEDRPELPWYKGLEGRTRIFTPEEQVAIPRQWRLWGRDREADFFDFLLGTGGRPYIDAKRLHWTNVFKPTNIQPTPSCHYLAAKNGNARTVPIPPQAWNALLRQMDNSLEGPWSWVDKEDMRRLWAKTQTAFPQLKGAVLYCTRHTYCTELYRRTRDVKLVKDMAGHKNYKTTEIYVHIVGDDSFERVAALLAGTAPAQPHLALVKDQG